MLLLPNRRGLWGADWCREPLWRRAGAKPSWHIAPVRTGTVTDLISGSQIITFTNSSPAWGFNSSGILVQPAANVPFIEYDPATGACLGWRVWDAVTNLALHSRDLTQTAWVKSGITPTRDQVGADGTANMATRLTATSSDGTALQTITSASATRASGFLIKRITGTGVIQITQDGGATWNTVSITNQWLRYPIAAATVTNPQIGFRIRSSGDEIAVDFAQLQSSSTLGPPVETGALTASSTADVASIAGAAFAGIWNDVESTVVCRFFSDNTAGSGRTSLLFDVGAGGAFGTTGYGVFNTSGWFINPTTAPMNLQSAVAVSAGTKAIGTMAARFKANDSRIAVNGTLGSLDSSCAVPASPTTLSIGRSGWSASVNYANGYIQELAILKSGRPDPNLTAISAT